MSSSVVRLATVTGVAMILAGVLAGAQDHQITESGGRDPVNIFVGVEGRTIVLTSLPEGARVEKGDIICELDPAELRDRIAAQEIVVQGAQADVHATRIGRDVAVMALNEYKEGGFRLEFATVERQIKLAESQLASAEDQLDWCRRMFEKGYTSMAEKVASELALKHARFGLEEAQSKKMVLIDHTRAKTIKTLTGAVEAARACELAKQAALERERSTLRRLTNQLSRCKVTAPAQGRITYAVPIGIGAVVHDGQLLGRVVADGASTTKAK